MLAVDLGFQPESFMTLQASPAEPKASAFGMYYANLVDAIRAWPDVGGGRRRQSSAADGELSVRPITTRYRQDLSVTIRKMLPGYFEAIGLSPVGGPFAQLRKDSAAGGASPSSISARPGSCFLTAPRPAA